MLQDLQVACRLLSRVCIEVRGEAGTTVTTTVAETLATSGEMAPAAEAMAPTADTPVPKAEATAPVADVAALAIDDPAELAEAPAPATAADKAASAGVPTTHNADGATAGPEGTGSEACSAPVDASADADAGADAGTDADAVVDWMWQRGDIAIKGSRRSSILEMSAEALGFRDAAHAAAMGLPPWHPHPGARCPLHAGNQRGPVDGERDAHAHVGPAGHQSDRDTPGARVYGGGGAHGDRGCHASEATQSP